MEEELKIITTLGAVTSREVGNLVKKNKRNVINGLNRLEKFGEIEILTFKTKEHSRRIYVTKKLYNNTIKAKITKR